MADPKVVVVDGSNLATEGRTAPSLRQLDEAVQAYAAEDPDAEIVVVVDASFEHRIDPAERPQLIEAELHGEVVSPPAGAIGRGDAFVLRIAERTGARVLSNDSFQEFHAEHPWLFDEGRLVGGKPVPGVGWIFTPRIPVRGPKSRQATGKAKRVAADALSPPVKAAELARAAKKVAARKVSRLPDGSAPKVGDVWPGPGSNGSGQEATAAPPGPASEPVEQVSDGTHHAATTHAATTHDAEKKAKGKQSRRRKPALNGETAAATTAPAPGAEAQGPAKATAAATRAPAEKTAKKASAKKAAAEKAPAEKAPAKKAAAKKAAAKKAPANKTAAEKAPVKRAAKKLPAEIAAAETATVEIAAAETATVEGVTVEGAASAVVENGATESTAPDGGAVEAPAKKRVPAKRAPAKKAAKQAAELAAPPSAPAGRTVRKEVGAREVAPAKRSSTRAAAARARTAPASTGEAAAPDAAGRERAKHDPELLDAIDQAVAEALSPQPPASDLERSGDERTKKAKADGKGTKRRRRRRTAEPPPAVNEPLAFITFVASFPLQSEVEGEVVSFTSHGAMVDVELPEGGILHCYIPLSAMGDPPPTKARQMLARGERRNFVLAGLDPPRRVAELALPGVPAAATAPG